MKYELIYDGQPQELQSKLPELEQNRIPEGGLAELVLNFRYRFPGFENVAVIVNDNLRNRAGVTPWPDTYQVVYVDPKLPVWRIRWQKGAAWAAYIVAALVSIAVIIFVLANWRLLRAIPETVERYPWLIPVGVLGLLAVLLVYSPTMKRRET